MKKKTVMRLAIIGLILWGGGVEPRVAQGRERVLKGRAPRKIRSFQRSSIFGPIYISKVSIVFLDNKIDPQGF